MRNFVVTGLLLTAMLAAVPSAEAQSDTPITVIVNSAAGGPVDLVARAMKDDMSANLGQPIIIENRPGAGGTTAAAAVMNMAADGNTLLFSGAGPMTLAPILYADTPYDPSEDFEYINLSAEVPVVYAINADVPAENLEDFIKLAKDAPGEINFGSSGLGTPAHLAIEYLEILADVDLFHIPFNGAPQTVAALLSGEISLYVGTPSYVLPHGKEKTMKLLMVTGPERLAEAPNLPTATELGFPDLTVPAWFGFLAPKGVPVEAVNRINAAAQQALRNPRVIEVLAKSNFKVLALGPKEFQEFHQKELALWEKIIADAGIQP